MKLTVNPKLLLSNLQTISGAIGANKVLPILDSFKFDLKDDKLTITATDLETTAVITMAVDSTSVGSACIPSKILIDSLKNLDDVFITISIDYKNSVTINTSNGKYSLVGEDVISYPKELEVSNKNSLAIPANVLVAGINKTIGATSNDSLRPVMTGVLFEIEENRLSFVATDAHRLVKYDVNVTATIGEGKSIVPKRTLNIIKSALVNSVEDAIVVYNSETLSVSCGNLRVSCRLVEGRYPDYKVIIPTDSSDTLTVDSTDLSNSLKRVSIFGNKQTSLVALDIKADTIEIEAQDIDNGIGGSESIEGKYNGNGIKIGFNAKYISDAINVCDTEQVNISLTTESKAGIVRPVGEDNLMILVMPLLLNA
jgi:DNA polymerase-3 subunit beta